MSDEENPRSPLEEENKEAEDAPQRFRRLLHGEPGEPGGEPSLPPSRHPTGAPDLTGGWMAEEWGAPPAQPDSPQAPTPAQGEQQESRAAKPTAPPGRTAGEEAPPFPPSPTPPASPPPIDPGAMALPQQVPERDMGATQVAPSAYVPPPGAPSRPIGQPTWRDDLRGCGGCLLRMTILGLFALAAFVIGVASFAIYQYYALAATLPPVEDLQSRAAQFETTRILDREGNVLYEILDPQAGRRTYVSLSRISPFMVAATIATEDAQFYSHPGYDLWGIARAIWQNLQTGGIASGASTITQQIARNLLFSPEERSRRTALRKIREVMLAAEITRRYTKDEILELYLNQVYFGNLAYGVEAAAETYFGTTADKLTLAQASFLAGLIQAPSVYDVYTNRDATLGRQRQVLSLMVIASQEQGCIYVSNSPESICVTPEAAGAAAAELNEYEFKAPDIPIRFPHWVNFVRAELEQLYDPQTIYRSGFTVYTTLDPDLQREAERIVREQVEALADRRATDGALVAIRPDTGEILAMVGSADFYNEAIDGQVNMAIRPRQPGSSIKPLTYAAAFEKGWTPATLIWDVPSEFPPSGNPDDPRPPYKPVNYDERFHGPVIVRSALANSYNIPAVKTLAFVGIYDDPATPEEEGLIAFAHRLGITTLTRSDYGLSLTLGGGDVTLLELTGAYAVFANNGLRVPPVSITRIVDHDGEVVYDYEFPPGTQVMRPEHAFLITSILSDNAARTPAFGPNSALNLPFPAAAKTGTTNDYRDNWTLGYTPDVVVGVWVGNADYTPMQDTSGLTGAAPIWNQFMQLAVQRLTGGLPTPFSRPPGIIEKVICAVSGTEPSEWCPSHKVEFFAEDQPPLPKEEDLWKKVLVDSFSLELASPECSQFTVEKLGLNVQDPWARQWIEEDKAGQEWAERMGFKKDEVFFVPQETCGADSPRPIVGFTDPPDGTTVTTSPLVIFGKAAATDEFKDWILEYGIGDSPATWPDLIRRETPVEQPAKLLEWDLEGMPNGRITLRLTVRSKRGGKATVELNLVLAMPTPTPTPTATPTPTLTPTPTNTPTPSLTPSVTPTPSKTPTPSLTPTP